jgi:hypothetical protein
MIRRYSGPRHFTAGWRRPHLERQRAVGQFRALLAPARQRCPEESRDRHCEEGRRDVRSVVDVLLERATLAGGAGPAADEADRIHVEEERHRAAVLLRLRVEDMCLPERQVERLDPRRVLVE